MVWIVSIKNNLRAMRRIRLRPGIIILFLLLCVSQMAKAENDHVVSVQTKSSDTDQTNTDEKTTGSVSDVGWPAHYGGVMLQGFYWGSFDESSWDKLGSPDTVALYSKYFDLIWVPQSGGMPYQGSRTMGYMPYYYFDHNSCFGSQDKLKAMIAAYKEKGTGIIEDVVINHRSSINQTDLLSFPTETYKGTDYHFTSSDVLNDDDGGATKAYLDYLNSLTDTKLSLSAYGEETCSSVDRQTCESFDGARDLDHRSANVQNTIKAYESFLLDATDGLGYSGFRYDMARGFLPKHLVDYNKSAKPRFSVGEVFDGNFNEVKWWLNHWTETTTVDGKQKVTHYNAAFDFPMHFSVMTQGFKNSDFSQRTGAFTLDASGKRTNTPLISDRALSRYAVTFVDNHDTYYPRYDLSMKNADNMVTSNILAANAYILGMPGTPCIYFKHWLDPTMRPTLEKLIMARKAAGIDNMSRITKNGYDPDDGDGYFAEVAGNGSSKVFMTFGTIDDKAINESLSDETKWKKVADGENFSFYISADAADTYNKYMEGTATPARWTDTAQDETTTDADCEANSTTSTIQLNGKRVCIYTTSPKLYAYICQGNGWTQLTGSFPGVNMMQNSAENHVTTETITGQDGKSRQYHIIEVYASDYLNIVLSTGDLNAQGQGINQTNDITNLTDNDVYLTFTPGDESVSNGKIATWTNITEEVTGNVKSDVIYDGYDIGTHSIYFDNSIGWYNPRVTVWNEDAKGTKTYFTSGNTDNSQALTTVVMGNKPYYVWNYTGEETAEPQHVVFSSGSTSPQSVNIPFEENSVYELSLTSKDASGQYDLERTTSADKWGKSADKGVTAKAFAATAKTKTVVRRAEGTETAKKTLTVYFLNSVNIDNVHAYAWYDHKYIDDDETKTQVSWPNFGGGWPGATMNLRPEKQGGYNIYSYTFTEDANGLLPDKIIFNSGGTGYGNDKAHGYQSVNIDNPTDGYLYELTSTGGTVNGDGNMVYQQKGTAAKYSKPYTVYFKNNGMTDPGIWWWGNGTEAGSDLKGSATTNVDYSNRPSMTKMTIKGYELYGYSFPSTMTSAPSNIKIEDKQGKGATIDGAEFRDEYVYTDKTTSVPLSEYKETSAVKTYTVYFRNKQNWSKVCLYTFGPELTGGWPGKEITTVDKGHDGIPLYKWTYTTDDPSFTLPTIIFNNDNGTQSPNLKFEDNKVYVLTNDYKLDEVNSKPYSDYKESFKFTIYFHNSVGWNEPHLWVWNNSGNFTGGDWNNKPAMTKTTLNGKSVWAWTYDPANLPADYKAVNGLPTTVIFAAADQPQSAKLDYKEGGVYKLSVTDKTDEDKTGSKHKLAAGSGQEDKEMQFLNRLYTRYIREGVISTLCLPFNLTSAELSAMKLRVYDLSTADAVVDKSNSTTDGLLSFHRVRNVEAFHPYIFINNSGTSGRIFNSKIISRKEWQWPSPEKTLSDLQKTVGDWTLQGNLVPDVVKTDSKTTYFGYAESTQSFIQMKKGKATVPASVCYFTLPTDKVKKAGYRFEGGELKQTGDAQTIGAKHFVVTLDDDSSTADVYVYGDGSSTTTGINGTTTVDALDDSAPRFNLAGQRVNKDYKGVVIQNGNKFIVK